MLQLEESHFSKGKKRRYLLSIMLGKRSRPVAIEKITGAIRAGIINRPASPRTPKTNYDYGGVGLGIIVALDKSIASGGEVLAKYAVGGQLASRSDPIPVNLPGNFAKLKGYCHEESLENYTYVTCRRPDKSVTRVYYDGKSANSPATSVLADRDLHEFCASEFLSSCLLCRKPLHGKDIFMYRYSPPSHNIIIINGKTDLDSIQVYITYAFIIQLSFLFFLFIFFFCRGEKAFCSAECRQRQIATDEKKEQRRSEVSRSPYTGSSRSSSVGGQIFSTGVVVV
ncbi:hypothetical protein Dimus_025820 [Dionaea muscipula]